MMLMPVFVGFVFFGTVTPSFWRALDGISFLGPIHTYSFRVRLDVFHVIWSGRNFRSFSGLLSVYLHL